MAVRLTTPQIQSLLETPKELPSNYQEILQRTVERRKNSSSSLQIDTENGIFVIILKQNLLNTRNFSAVLGHRAPGQSRLFHLRRYNGWHRHRNIIENKTIEGFHIHIATERYQKLGEEEEAYAEKTDRYSTLAGALECLLKDCNFLRPNNQQLRLFN